MLRPNPVTGVLEDDGLPDPGAPLAPPPLQAVPDSTGGGPSIPAPAAAPIQIVAPPEETHRVEQTGPQTTVNKPTEESRSALDDLKAANDRETSASADLTDNKLLLADVEAQKAEQLKAAAEERQRQEAAARAEHQRQVQVLTAEREKRRQEEERLSHPTTYWEDKSVPSKILAGLLMAVGGAASGLAGKPNGTLEVFRQAEADDRQRKIDAFKNSREFRELAERDLAGATTALKDKLAQIAEQEITKGNVIAKNAEALAKRMGIPGVLAEQQKLQAGIQADQAEKRAKLAQHYDEKVQSGRQTTSDTVNVNKNPTSGDLTALTADGKTYGAWRTKDEAEKGRAAQAALTGFRKALDDLNKHLVDKGRSYKVLGVNVSDSRADRDAYIATASTYLQQLRDAGVLNESEYKRNAADLDATLSKSGKDAARANDLLFKGVTDKYDSKLAGQAVKAQATQQPQPAAKPQQNAKPDPKEANADLARVNARLKALPSGAPERGRLEALRRRIMAAGASE